MFSDFVLFFSFSFEFFFFLKFAVLFYEKKEKESLVLEEARRWEDLGGDAWSRNHDQNILYNFSTTKNELYSVESLPWHTLVLPLVVGAVSRALLELLQDMDGDPVWELWDGV